MDMTCNCTPGSKLLATSDPQKLCNYIKKIRNPHNRPGATHNKAYNWYDYSIIVFRIQNYSHTPISKNCEIKKN